MKARQLSISFSSVYALGLLDQVRIIRRGPDGFWGPWQATGVNAKRLLHAGTVTALIGLDDRVAVYEQLPGRVQHAWDFRASELSVVALPRGGGALFAVSAGRVWRAEKESVLAPWSSWEPLGGPVDHVVALNVPRRGITVCATHAGAVYCISQDAPASAWSSWESMGTPGGGVEELAMSVLKRGGLAVFARGRDGAVYQRRQDRAGGRWREWESLGGLARSLSVAHTTSGGLALFVTGPDGRVAARYQSQPFARWTPWRDLQGNAKVVLGQQSYTDGLEAFVLGADDELRHAWCERLGAPWTDWLLLERETAGLRLDESPEAPVAVPRVG